MLQPLTLGFGRFCLTSSAFLQTKDWNFAHFICWRRLSDVGGNPSFFYPFSSFSFALLPAISFFVYRVHTKTSHTDVVSPLSVVSLPSCDTLVWCKSLLRNVLKVCFLPIRNIELLESQPVSARNCGKVSHSCGPNLAAALCIGIYLSLFFIPVWNHSSWQLRLLKCAAHSSLQLHQCPVVGSQSFCDHDYQQSSVCFLIMWSQRCPILTMSCDHLDCPLTVPEATT